MEDLLTQVVTISNNFPDIQKAAQRAVDFLAIQQGLIRDPAYELREKCLLVLQLCLETKRSKFTALAIAGFHKIIRDDRFHSNIEPEDDSKWLPMQLLQATNAFLSLSDDTQVDILKILLNIACSKKWAMNGRIVIAIVCLCSEAFESGNAAVRTAAQAAASQTLRSFCIILEEDLDEGDEDASSFNEIIPVMQFLCSRIDAAECSSRCEHGVVFLLECLLTLCSSLPQTVYLNKHLHTFLWQKFCPVLISVLGTPRVDKHIVTRPSGVEKEKGRGSGGLGTAPSFSSFHAKTVYSINTELVRLVGSVASLRPVLESVFHRVLLYPAPKHRLDALRAVTELMHNPNRLLDIAGPMFEEGEASLCDMSLLRLIMDSVEESVKCSFSVMEASVMSCFSLLKALEELCLGRCIPSAIAETICDMYPKLPDSDYIGPKTYQSLNRLPQLYRERIQKSAKSASIDEYDATDGVEYDSNSSGETEGPEDEQILELQDVELELGSGKIPTILNVDPFDIPLSLGDTERQRARHFVGALHELLPLLIPMRSSIQVDQALQSFASQYCEGVMSDQSSDRLGVVNADGIYLATYSALLLDMKLLQCNYYSSPRKQIMITEEDFIAKVQGSVVGFLSSVWLRELYQAVVSSSLLQTHGYISTNNSSQPHALINLLTDVEGVGSYQQGSQMLWECRRLEKTSTQNDDNLEAEAGLRLSRRILTCCWETVLKVLAVPLSKGRFKSRSEKFRDLKFLGGEDHNREVKQIITTCIEGLQITARLCNNLGLQDRCGSILELLVSASCAETVLKKPKLLRIQPTNSDVVRLTPSHALSLDLILGSGLELGSHCAECWPHVFRCCIYVRKLEHKYFSKSENRALGSTTKVMRKEENFNVTKDVNLTFDPELEEDMCVDVYSFLCSTDLPQAVSEIVSTSQRTSDGVLKASETAKVICVLSQFVDKLFEEAALKLNLKSLECFSRALCVSSHKQLFPPSYDDSELKGPWWEKFYSTQEQSSDALLVDSVGEFMLKCVRSGRPLFHVLRIWSIIGLHLMEAACHKDLTISRKAVKHIHDVMNTVLSEHSELPHFHINETLFKPFENLLGFELCEPDILDQILSCICEFVETSFTEIRSGWRPLFGALRAVSTNVNLLLDVFRVFSETDNVLVFSNAAVDYIKCLLKHLRCQSRTNHNTQIGSEILKYIKRCQNVLASIYKMPHAFVFHSARHIQDSDGLLVDPVIPDNEIFNFQNLSDDLKFESDVSYDLLFSSLNDFEFSLEMIDRQSGVLRVWFLLMEGLYSAAISANTSFQPFLLDMLYSDLAKLIDEPGPLFGLFVFNRLILPMSQSWLRQLVKIPEGNFSGLKQSIGLLSDSVLHYFERLQTDKTCESHLTLLLDQVLLLLSECCVHPIPAVARIGPACMRHIIASVGKTFTDVQWEIVTLALHRSCDITLIFLRQLMGPFSVDSQYYYGDSGQVKVAARRGATAQDVLSSLQLSQQVFLLDEQREDFSPIPGEESSDDQKIYTFLVSTCDDDVVRIPMKLLVISLLSHQSILQVIAEILLQGTKHYISSLSNVLNRNNSSEKSCNISMPGLMDCLKTEKLKILLSCLDYSYHCALAFDSRPGLKFLIQKVAGLEQAANLYRQAGAAWAIKLVCLFEYSLTRIERSELSCEEVKKILDDSDVENDLSLFLNEFRKSFDDLCNTYMKVVLDNSTEVISPHSEKPLFFLIASQDDSYPEVKKDFKEEIDEEKSQKPFVLADFSKESCNSSFDSDELSQGRTVDEQEKSEEERENTNSKDEELRDDGAIMQALEDFKRKKTHYVRPKKPPVKFTKEPLVPPEIEQQRRRSFLKDSEALRRVWTEMLASVFELLQQLSNEEFRKLLPIYIDGVRRLMVCVSEPILKQAVSELFQRIAIVYGFGKSRRTYIRLMYSLMIKRYIKQLKETKEYQRERQWLCIYESFHLL